MNTSEKGITVSKYMMDGNALMLNTIEILDDKKESILSEILKCCICFELPAGKQVKICEKGHHFCLSCHNKMEFCGMCRGKLLETRNFVVEELVTQLGAVLGIPRSKQPPAEPPLSLSPGLYKCLHCYLHEMPAYQMLPHLREKHSDHLIENVRSNPYSGQFSFKYNLHFKKDEKYIWSAQISDMGLFTVELTFTGLDFFGCVRAFGDKTVSSLFRYQLVVKIPNVNSGSVVEFGLSECPISSYLDDIESLKREGRGLKIKGENLLEYIELENTVSIFFSIWKTPVKLENEVSSPSVFCLPERNLFFKNDRKTRRNRSRNMRRKKLREKMKHLPVLSDDLGKVFSGLSF